MRALAWIGGCPEKLVPDNLKTGVTDACYYDPVLNRSYHELARHYGIAVLPARVRRPRCGFQCKAARYSNLMAATIPT